MAPSSCGSMCTTSRSLFTYSAKNCTFFDGSLLPSFKSSIMHKSSCVSTVPDVSLSYSSKTSFIFLSVRPPKNEFMLPILNYLSLGRRRRKRRRNKNISHCIACTHSVTYALQPPPKAFRNRNSVEEETTLLRNVNCQWLEKKNAILVWRRGLWQPCHAWLLL